MNKVNYQSVMERMIEDNCIKPGKTPRLLLHSCCGPCSSYCLALLSEYFEVTVFYYNPNIYPPEEYHVRAEEQERFIREFPTRHPVHFVEGAYDTDRFYEMAKGLEEVPEGGERCFACYRLRLEESMKYAKAQTNANAFDFVTTTLSISPLKNVEKLNEIGRDLEAEYGVPYLYSDFKKKDGYKKSTRLSAEYQMYRQYYCGCIYSKVQRDQEIAAKNVESKADNKAEKNT